MEYLAGKYDIAVIGAGHAGIEAALAAARLGCTVVCFAINLDSVGNMPCNPAIGGTAKGHLVREIDALGGEMGKAADDTCIQYRMLNRGKGPAVYSLRAQGDRRAYQARMKGTLEAQENLDLVQAEIVDVGIRDGKVESVLTASGGRYEVRAAIIATGTYLGGKTTVGEVAREGGPDGMFAAKELTRNLVAAGVPLRRFKTGTPPRINARSVDFSVLEPQPGDEDIYPFSFDTTKKIQHLLSTSYRECRNYKISPTSKCITHNCRKLYSIVNWLIMCSTSIRGFHNNIIRLRNKLWILNQWTIVITNITRKN